MSCSSRWRSTSDTKWTGRNRLAHNKKWMRVELRGSVHVTVNIHGFKTGRYAPCTRRFPFMNQIIYIVGLVVIVLAILSFFGFR